MRRSHSIYNVCNIDTFVKVEEPSWNNIVISFMIPKRRGQKIKATFRYSDKISHIWIDNYEDYAAIRVTTKKGYYTSKSSCIAYCNSIITSISKYVDFEASDVLISKELMNLL